MIFKIFYPHPSLADIVEYYFYSKIEDEDSPIEQYHTPLLQGLAFNFCKISATHEFDGKLVECYKKAYFFTQPTCPRVINANSKNVDIYCVKFSPLGIAKLTGINMERMSDCAIAAEDIWGNDLEFLFDEMQSATSIENTFKVLGKFLLKKHLQINKPHQSFIASNVLKLIEKSHGNVLIKDLQNHTNTTKKTLERSFTQNIGVSPKLYSQIVQFNSAKTVLDLMLAKQQVAKVGLNMGYYNNSHFAARFKRFSGLTPKQYLLNNRI